jgi:SAM-dependent methyltransferase
VDAYQELANDYEWLYPNESLSGEFYLDGYSHLLDALPQQARIHDAACGIGIESAALAARGFRVTASDGSPAMARKARQRLEPLGIPVAVSRWHELPDHCPGPFDAVVCNGNSLVHAGERNDMVDALAGMANVLAPEGAVVVGSRNYEFLRTETPLLEVRNEPIHRDGTTCIVVNRWDIPDAWNQVHRLTLLFIFLTDDGLEWRTYPIEMVPYRFEDLVDRVTAAGFAGIESDYSPERPSFTLTARLA